MHITVTAVSILVLVETLISSYLTGVERIYVNSNFLKMNLMNTVAAVPSGTIKKCLLNEHE